MIWWRDHRSAEQAEKWFNRILLRLGTLREYPERFPHAPETDMFPTGLRQVLFGVSSRATHRILFSIVNDKVVVVRVRHVAQRNLLFDDLKDLN